MPLRKFLIAPLSEGLIDAQEPWIIPENAFAQLDNVYVWRGRLKKRFGTQLMENTSDPLKSRLRVQIGTTQDPSGNLPAQKIPGSSAFWANLGQQFSVGDTIFTVYQNGAMLSTGTATGSYDTANGEVTINGNTENPGTAVYWYPTLPVMGLFQRETEQINDEPLLAFDRQFAYEFDQGAGGFDILGPTAARDTVGPPVAGSGMWSSSEIQFHQAITWRDTDENDPTRNRNLTYVVNNKRQSSNAFLGELDGIKYYDHVDQVWYTPEFQLDNVNNNVLQGARQVRQFKGRLLFFSTIEFINQNRQFTNRVRYSWTKAVNRHEIADAFFEASGKGGYIDAPTDEAIVTTQFVKDRLVVYFERSTYQLLYTGAPDLPFRWHQIDPAIGAESMLSQVPFDTAVVGIGQSGIHSCNGASVQRIDQKIPSSVWQIKNQNDAFERVAGIRDFNEQMVYWTYPAANQNLPSDVYPQKVLAYNYERGTWSFFDDSFTVFGYHHMIEGFTWGTWNTPWGSSDWPWSYSENIQKTQRVIAGNQRGYVVMLAHNVAQNAPALDITQMDGQTITIYNHNLEAGDFIRIRRAQGSTNLNDTIVQVLSTSTVNPEQIVIGIEADAGYTGGGMAERISKISFKTKRFNFFTKEGREAVIPYVDFLVDKTGAGAITADFQLSGTSLSFREQGQSSDAILGTNVLETYPYNTIETNADRFWHRVYYQAQSDFIQLHFYFTDEQMAESSIVDAPFVLHAMLIHTEPVGTRLGG